MAFVCDQLPISRNLHILMVVDPYFQRSPVIDPQTSDCDEDVVATLEKESRKICYPKLIRVGNDRELISRSMDLWAY